jgi:hypothetical protein
MAGNLRTKTNKKKFINSLDSYHACKMSIKRYKQIIMNSNIVENCRTNETPNLSLMGILLQVITIKQFKHEITMQKKAM